MDNPTTPLIEWTRKQALEHAVQTRARTCRGLLCGFLEWQIIRKWEFGQCIQTATTDIGTLTGLAAQARIKNSVTPAPQIMSSWRIQYGRRVPPPMQHIHVCLKLSSTTQSSGFPDLFA